MQGSTHMFQFIAKALIKDGDEVCGARCGRVPSTGTSVPMELGCITLWHIDVFANLEVFKLCSSGVLWRYAQY